MKNNLKNNSTLAQRIDNVFGLISYIFKDPLKQEKSLISDEASEILNNPNDKIEIERAIDFLQKNRDVKSKEVTLSDRTIVMSIG